MGLFADMGRSTAFQTGQGVFKDAVASGQMDRQSLMDAITMKHQGDQMALAQQEAARKQADYEHNNETLFVDDTLKQGEAAGMPTQTNWLMKTAKEMGVAKPITMPDGTTKWGYRRSDLKDIVTSSQHSKEAQASMAYNKYQDLSMQVESAQTALGKAKDPTEQQAAQDNLDNLIKQRTAVKNGMLLLAGKDPGMGSKLGGPKFQSDSGEIFYQSPNGLVDAQQTPYDPQAHGGLKAVAEQKDNEIELRRKALAGDKGSQAILDSQMKDKIKLAEAGRAVFSNMPTGTPGISFERKTGRYFKVDSTGNKEYISSEETKNERLKFIEDQPASNIKTMKQSAPHVLTLVGSSENALNNASGDMGAIKGRFNEFMTGKVGSTNKDWIALRTNVKLLETRLMQMHVGARGGEYILKHFENIFSYGYQSPDNMREAFRDVRQYANEVNKSSVKSGGGGGSGVGAGVTHRYNPATGLVEEVK